MEISCLFCKLGHLVIFNSLVLDSVTWIWSTGESSKAHTCKVTLLTDNLYFCPDVIWHANLFRLEGQNLGCSDRSRQLMTLTELLICYYLYNLSPFFVTNTMRKVWPNHKTAESKKCACWVPIAPPPIVARSWLRARGATFLSFFFSCDDKIDSMYILFYTSTCSRCASDSTHPIAPLAKPGNYYSMCPGDHITRLLTKSRLKTSGIGSLLMTGTADWLQLDNVNKASIVPITFHESWEQILAIPKCEKQNWWNRTELYTVARQGHVTQMLE